jgi:hypothetical protein
VTIHLPPDEVIEIIHAEPPFLVGVRRGGPARERVVVKSAHDGRGWTPISKLLADLHLEEETVKVTVDMPAALVHGLRMKATAEDRSFAAELRQAVRGHVAS